jgi:hypothetical protein
VGRHSAVGAGDIEVIALWRYKFTEHTTGGYLWSQWMVCSDGETEDDCRDIAEDLIGDFGTVVEIEIKRQ